MQDTGGSSTSPVGFACGINNVDGPERPASIGIFGNNNPN